MVCLELYCILTFLVDDPLSKRHRVTFQPEEDRIIYQAVSLLKKYVRSSGVPWIMLKPIMPDRKGSSIKKRYEYLSVKMKGRINQFLDIFETRYSEAQKRGEVKAIKTGMMFDLQYCLNWYNTGGFEAQEGQQEQSKYVPPISSSRRCRDISQNALELPKHLADLVRYYDIEDIEPRAHWRSDYDRKEGASSARRHDALYRDTFTFPDCQTDEYMATDQNGERMESLIKVLM
jgi:hypothetical protein